MCMQLHCIVLKGLEVNLLCVTFVCILVFTPDKGFRCRSCQRIKRIDTHTGGCRYIADTCSRRQWVTIIVLIRSMCDVCFVSHVKLARFNYKDLSRWMPEFEVVR